jgi:hypothetical protein
MWFVIKFVAGLVILKIMTVGWDSVVMCVSPGEAVEIQAKIMGAFLSIFIYPIYSLDVGGISEDFKNNPYTTQACVWKQFVAFKSYVWIYITACVVASIAMIEDKIKESK